MALLIGAFVAIIIGVSLVGVVATQEQTVSTLTIASNVSFDISNARTGSEGDLTPGYQFWVAQNYNGTNWKQDDTDCQITLTFRNQTAGALTAGTDYHYTNDLGNFSLANVSIIVADLTNTTTYDYNYCPDDYITEAWTRTILGVVIGFFAIAIMVIGVALTFGVMKNEGLMNI